MSIDVYDSIENISIYNSPEEFDRNNVDLHRQTFHEFHDGLRK